MDPKEPKSIRVAFLVEGTRGDVQPYIALALRLQDRGNAVKMFTNINHVPLCKSFGLEVEGCLYDSVVIVERPDLKKALAQGDSMTVNKGLNEIRLENFSDDIVKVFDGFKEFKPTVIAYGMLSRTKALAYSIDKTIPAISVELQVMLPVSDTPVGGLPKLPFGMNKLWFKLLIMRASKMLAAIKEKMKVAMNIDLHGRYEMAYATAFLYDIPSVPTPCFYGISKEVIPVHPEWPTDNFNMSGFFVVDKKTQERMMEAKGEHAVYGESNVNDSLKKFLAAGAAPVYMGWGSMVCNGPEWMTAIAVGALKHAGARGVLLGGWSGIKEEAVPEDLKDYAKEHVIFVPSAAHEWLFPQCACMVHHGGSGTTAASVRSGRPTVITPLMGDQYDFADGINRVGCGVGLGKFGNLNAAQLGDAVKKCIEDQSIIDSAKAAGERLSKEDGCENFIKVFDAWIADDFQTGKWLEKHNGMLEKCKEEVAGSSCCLQ